MTTENMNEMEASMLSDEQLDDIVGGAIRQEASGKWSVLDDKTRQVVQTLDSRQAAMAYAKRFGYGTNIVK